MAASLSLVACGGKKEGDAGKGSDLTQPVKPAPGPGAFEKLEVTLDGVRVPVETAIAKMLPDGRVQLYLSPKKVVTCKELLVNVFNDKTPDSVLVDLVARLAADGKDTYTTGDLYMGTPNATDPGGKATVGGAATKDAKVDVTLDFTGTTGFEKKKLVVKGAVAVTGCGAQDTTTGPGVSTTPASSTRP
ncbi:MAG: hypothetical protein NT062_05335, partial [Proteobacteria bacterium]|nr:hypothetical protein [Pseudomonadota bacterium]